MKKLLFILTVALAPVFLLAQPMDTVTTFTENFDGATLKVTTTHSTSPMLGGQDGDWRLVGDGYTWTNWVYYNLYKSAPNSFHTPIYYNSGYSNATTDEIPLLNSGVNVNYVYFEFDHICKVSALDNAQIYYQVAHGEDEYGNLNWGQWKLLNFSSNSSFYYGEAKSTSATAISGGKFSDAAYSIWNANAPLQVPTNAWWRHEMFDLSSQILNDGTNPTHFRFQFRANRLSPETSGTENCAGWYVDNLRVRFSNCELIKPTITIQPPYYYNTNASFVNQVGPFNIKAKLYDNDTIAENTVSFTYEINSGPTVTVPNTGAFTSDVLNSNGHTIQAVWQLPTVCYQDTIRYHIYMEDTHGSSTRFDTFLVAHHNYPNINQNDIRLDSLNKNQLPHCLNTGVPQNINVYFTNRSDAAHSPTNNSMTSGTFKIEVRDENNVLFHEQTHTWNGDICFDVPSSLSMGTFSPHHGFNYVKVFVVSRNGQEDGFHDNDTLELSPYSCDSLLSGHYTVGGTNPDFEDMEAVKQSLNYCGLDGPVVFHLRPGTYTDFVFDSTFVGQSSVNTITFEGDDVNSVFVTNNRTDAGANVFGAVTLIHVNDYIFKNLTIQGNNSATASRGVVIRGNGCDNILFDGCHITAHNTHTTATTSCAVSRTTAATSIPDTVTFRNCTITGGNFGIHYVGSNARKNQVTIEGCNITSCYRGIYTNYTNGSITNNHIKQVPSQLPQNFSGIYSNYVIGADINGNTVDSVSRLEYAIYLGNASTSDFYVRNNHVKAGNGNVGIYLTNSSSSNTITGYLYNNEVILYPVTAANSYAMQINSSNNLRLINNSLLAKSDAPYSNSAALYISNNNNTYIYNNLLLNQVVNSDNTGYPLYLNGTSRATGSYNDLYSISGVVAYKTVVRNTISELESADTNLSHNISLLPPFANSSVSLMPTSYTGLECWRNSAVMTDVRNLNRTEVTYMGAYADQIPAVDAALTALVSPSLGECPQSTYNITVEITNKGSETLNFASHSAVVNIRSTALNLNENVNVNTGSVAALGKSNVVVAQNVPVPVNQSVDFQITITTNGDNNHANDTLVRTFVLEAIVPDYTEDFNNGTQQTWTIQQVSGAGNWTVQNGPGVQPNITPVYGTGRLFFNSKNFSNTTVSRAIMPVVTLNNAINPILEIWFAHDNGSNKPNEGITVKVSTDGGISYSSLTAIGQSAPLIKRYKQTATTPEWQLYTFNLAPYQNAGCVYVAIEAAAQGGNNINIDRIRVRNLYDNDIAVSTIYGAGETPAQYGMRGVISAVVKNEGAQAQSNVPIYLTVAGAAEQWLDTLIVPSLPYQGSTIVTFPDHLYNVEEVKDVEVRAANDQHNINNAMHWRMVTTHNVANYADTTSDIVLIGDYNNVIRPCVRYKTNEDLSVTAVRYYYDHAFISDPGNGFRAFVADASGNVLSTSEVIDFSTLQQYQWNTIPIENFALTNTTGEFYVGIEMLSHGQYLCAQVETPLRDSTFYYLSNGVYEPQLSGRFMIGAVVDTPFVHDVALLSLSHPVTNCDLGHEHLNVVLTNNGTTDIVPPMQLHYTINGGATVTENFTDTLHSHETTTYVFNNNFDFTNDKIDTNDNYQIRVWVTKLAQDRLTFNDTLDELVVSRGKSNVPTVQDTVIVNYHTVGTLHAQLPSSIPQGVIGWYTNSGYENWNLLVYNTGTYTTPVIYFDTTYYATATPGTLETKIVGTGTASGQDPLTFDKGYSRGRILYTQQEIGTYGTITSFALNVKTASNANASAGIPMRIYMKCVDESSFNSTNVDWDAELIGATLVLEKRVYFNHTGWFDLDMLTPFDFTTGNLAIYMETNCADSCTGTGNQCNNCGVYVSGAASYPSFNETATTVTQCQKKSGNTAAQMTGTYTNVARKPNVRFIVANLECGSQKVPIRIHVPDIPNYDVETQAMTYPESGCALYNEHIKVQVKNMLNTPIPANKVVIHAVFNGTEVTHTIAEEFTSEETKLVEFANPFDFSAPNNNITFNYVIYTTLNNEAIVYTGNDTITGTIVSTKTAYMPDVITYTGSYTQTYTILEPADRPSNVTQYTFYDAEDAVTPVHTTGTNPSTHYYTTNPLYDTVVYWVTGKTQGSNCITKRIKVIINVFHPEYDLSTDELLYPVSYQCSNSLSPNLQVKVTNQDTTSSSVIPNGTFNLKAEFTGSANVNATNLITTPISSLTQETITFANGMNLGSPDHNRIYQYVIYTTPADATMPVYTLNDTISGSMYVPALPVAPQPLSYTVPYGGTQTVTPTSSSLTHYYFYDSSTGGEAIAEGNSFTTDPIYDTVTYYYSGRIESDGFHEDVIAGPQNLTNQTSSPFTLTNGHSYVKILYNKEDMGGAKGRIDSIFFHLCTADNNGVGIPMKFWLKDTTNVQAIGTGSKNINWLTETSNARLVFDGELALDAVGWVGFAVPGGYDFNGEGLLLYAEHDCGSASCVTTHGVSPTPKFTNSQMASNGKKAYTKAQNNNPLTGTTSFSLSNYRVNTKFSMNYTCESPRAPITINTSVPQHDVGVVAITAPVTQNNSYTTNETVTVTLQNFGTTAASGFPVSYQLANNAPVTQNYTSSLAAGATATMTFTTSCDLTSVYYSTPFKAYTGLATDTYHANDTTTIFLSVEDVDESRPLSSADGAHITNVTFAALNNGTGAPYLNHPVAPGNGMYSDFTQTVAPVVVILGQEYTMSVTHAFTASTTKTVHKRAWIDYNRNGVFEDSEIVFAKSPVLAGDSNAVSTDFVNIPTTADIGLTRMRVICAATNQTSPTGYYNSDGETEDYAVLLSPAMEVDLGIPAILHPVGDICADDHAKIRVNLRNYGTETQTLSSSNPATITAVVTGAVPATYTKVVDANVILAPNSEMTVVIPDVDFSAQGTYNVSFSLDYAGDQYMTNNTRASKATVSSTAVTQLPFVETFMPQGTDPNNPQLPQGWEVKGFTATGAEQTNYVWKETVKDSPNSGNGGGPAHDHTYAGTFQEDFGGYVSVAGVNSATNENKWTTLTSGCVNMHYNQIYPAELYFYKYFAGASNTSFLMNVQVGSGEYYQTIAQLTKEDGGQTGSHDLWNEHQIVMHTVDEVARLRFTVTGQRFRIDPSIDDINMIIGLPDLAMSRIVYPMDKSLTDDCLSINSVVVPIVEIYNNGNSAVEEFDVQFFVGVGDDIVTTTEHVVRHLDAGDTMQYTSTNEFVVTNLSNNWEVRSTVVIPDDKDNYNNTKRSLSCTNVGLDDYESEQNVYLGQNEPNPAVTSTRIPYSVPEPGKVTFDIVTTAGQVIYTTTQEAEMGINYLDLNTANLAVGVYYYTMRYNNTVLTKKMVVEK